MSTHKKTAAGILRRLGGTYQLVIRQAADLDALAQLDEPFWVATSAPVAQLRCDPVLTARLDSDGSGRVQSGAIKHAWRWARSLLRDMSGVTEASPTLVLAHLNADSEAGARLLETACRVLANLGAEDDSTVSLAQVRDRKSILARGAHNGDGVIPPASLDDDALRSFAEDVLRTIGGREDASGQLGVDAQALDLFVDEGTRLLKWLATSQEDGGASQVFPLGEATGRHYQLVCKLREAIDAFFARSETTLFVQALGRTWHDSAFEPGLDTEEEAEAFLNGAPLAPLNSNGRLDLAGPLNPRWRDQLQRLEQEVLAPVLGADFKDRELSRADWDRIKAVFAAHEGWLEQRGGQRVEVLGAEKVRDYLDSNLPDRLRAAIMSDREAGEDLAALADLEYLILIQRWMIELCNNFASFPYLYRPEREAIFEAGRLVMDGRVFSVNFYVDDVAAHSVVAANSRIFLLYSEVTGSASQPPFHIVTPVVCGRKLNLTVGKRGVLFDRDGMQWDARVVRVVDNPVSFEEALAAPFKRLGALLSSTAEKVTAGAEQQLQSQVTAAATTIEGGVKEGISTANSVSPEEQPPRGRGSDGLRDMVLTSGIAIAALASSFAFVVDTFRQLQPTHIFVAVLIGLLVVLVPTALLAWLRLRSRNLSALLEGSGWAVNAPMRLTRRVRRLIMPEPILGPTFKKRRW